MGKECKGSKVIKVGKDIKDGKDRKENCNKPNYSIKFFVYIYQFFQIIHWI